MPERNDRPATADVYAGDTTALPPGSGAGSRVFVFRIEADAEPDAFARIASVFNIANTAPERVSLGRGAAGQLSISVEIELAREVTAEMIRRKLEQLTCTITAKAVEASSNAAAS